MSTPHTQTGAGALQRYVLEGAEQALMPALSIEQVVERFQQLTSFVGRTLVEGRDYGAIPGTDKKTLLKPGAEKLTTFFGLTRQFAIIRQVEDWTGERHGGQPFFYYLYRCRLLRGDVLIAEADGSCNSREAKYRWRETQRKCPECGVAAIIRGREEYGGGFICFRKKGGCGAKFHDTAPAIIGQQVGRVENPDVCDLVNTIQKMSQKRALIAATLLAVNASEFFTQDIEDFDANLINVTHGRASAAQSPANVPRRSEPPPAGPPARPAGASARPLIRRVEEMRDRLLEREVEETTLNDILGQYGCTELYELTDGDAKRYLADLSDLLNQTLKVGRPRFGEEGGSY